MFDLDTLEIRRLLSVDLTVSISTLGGPTPAARGDVLPASFDVGITVFNHGNTPAFGTISGKVVLTRDTVVGNADDFQVGDFSFNDGVGPDNHFIIEANLTMPIPDDAPIGEYLLGAVVDDQNQIAETSELNNSAVQSPPQVTVVSDPLPSGTIIGTAGDDVILIAQSPSHLFVTVNGATQVRDLDLDKLVIDGGSGNDKIVATVDVLTPMSATGAGGNDTIVGGSGDDELSGANGKDRIIGGGGNDYLLGGALRDYLNGGAGDDTLSGAGGKDRLFGDIGADYMLGGSGDDLLDATWTQHNVDDGAIDTLSGNSGTDTGVYHTQDPIASIENKVLV
jgi:Ca2+-binding RTX toxin-like protein